MQRRRHTERELFARLRAAPTPANREAAVKRYLPLAHAVAARYRCCVEPIGDLEEVAAIGLLDAIDRFDPDGGTAFTSFAVPSILGELGAWALHVRRGDRELIQGLERARGALATTLGEEPTVAELSREVGLSQELVLHLLLDSRLLKLRAAAG